MNKKCQVFTPADYVEELLDSVGYTVNLTGKKILENSCGDGNILVAVVQRYIDDCRKRNIADEKIAIGLEKDIYGIEIDKSQYVKCIDNLNIILEKNNLESIVWNIFNEDYLRRNDDTEYQFIVGNPPYITYKEMDEQNQKFLKKSFLSCRKGKFDYCYAFIEKSINCLAEDGKMAYLIPSSIFKTVFGENLRNYMKPYVAEIRDFTQVKMFDNALVKSAIMVSHKARNKENLHYTDIAAKIEIDIPVNALLDKWVFSNDIVPGTRRFGDYFQVSHVVATLLNEAYVLKKDNYIEQSQHYICNGINIEKSVVRDTATPRSQRYKKIEKIIFPYDYQKGKLVKYTEDEFDKMFPGASSYLNKFREQLDDREHDNNAKWFEYGRSQALSGLNHQKLLVSTVVTEKMPVYFLTKKCIPYAGMYIVPKKNNRLYRLKDAKMFLESDEFMQYVKRVGIHISGSSLRITSKDIENYMF